MPNTTPVPNALFDVYLKTLTMSELKVLLLVVRQTLGWVDARSITNRKERDWISNSQLRSKTGLSRRAISLATEALVTKRLIDVLDHAGRPLRAAAQRKGKMRLFYCAAPTLSVPVDTAGITPWQRLQEAVAGASVAQDVRMRVTALAQAMRTTKET